MQYLKCTRLHQARLLMVRQGMSAQAVCHAVGYASASQFNREFKRLFGRSHWPRPGACARVSRCRRRRGRRSTCRRISGERTLRWALAIENRPSGARMGSDEEKGTDPTGQATLFSSTTGRLSSDDTTPPCCKARHTLRQGLL
ncbi:TPA: helix-turn-helix domain-containing protein [Pseudomonas aeruginosa]|nr:helix-turn-helix domain-containing protein [Pseudomonas aeruginosa]